MALISSNKDIPLAEDTITSIAQHDGTPYYLYDAGIIREQTNSIKKLLGEDTSLFFASFCNSNPDLLNVLKESGIGILASSPAELLLADSVGFAASNITVTGSPFSDSELRQFLNRHIHLNIDSLGQLLRVGEISPGANVGIRVNLLSCVSTNNNLPINACVGVQSRVGILEVEIQKAREIAIQNDLNITTLHAYTGTNQLNDTLLLRALDALLKIAMELPSVNYINLGGGFGITYNKDSAPFPWDNFKNESNQKLKEFRSATGRDIKLQFEPGRIIVGPSGFLVAEVLDVKERPSGEIFVATNASLSNFPRPYIYGANGQHDVSIIHLKNTDLKEYRVTICGNALASGDRLAESVSVIGKPQIGDLVVIHDAGAYGYSMSSRFSGRNRPPEFLLNDGSIMSIRQREESRNILSGTRFEETFIPKNTDSKSIRIIQDYYQNTLFNGWLFDHSQIRQPIEELRLVRDLASEDLAAALMLSQRNAAMLKAKTYLPPEEFILMQKNYESDFFITQAISLLNVVSDKSSNATAKRISNGYIINGSYPWVTGFDLAQKLVLGVKTDSGGQALFLVDTNSASIVASPIRELSTLADSLTVSLKFNNFEVSDNQLLRISESAVPGILLAHPSGNIFPYPTLHSTAIAIGFGIANLRQSRNLLEPDDPSGLFDNLIDLERGAEQLFLDLASIVESQTQDLFHFENIRARANAFAIKANKFLCILSKGKSLISSSIANQLSRESEFLLAWGLSPRAEKLTAEYIIR